MQTPVIPKDEATRLNNLRSINILDTPSEERFDRITRLAKRLFDVPIALVSLVDENRQWFKSCFGLDVRETPRDISFCGHTILGREPFVISDATCDSRFADNPLVTGDPLIRFYAGCPLVYLDGTRLGTLCIIDRKPRYLSDDDIAALWDLAVMVEQELNAIQLATIDELTKISNRRGFTALAQSCLSQCRCGHSDVSLAFLDLNRFKAINDRFGHAEGDRALITFAGLMRQSFRDLDLCGRIGGDEFAVLLTDTNSIQAKEVVERFRRAVERHNRAALKGYDLSFCEGVVELDPEQEISVERLLAQADQVMYTRKAQRLRVSD